MVKEAQLALKAFLEQPGFKGQQAHGAKQARQEPLVFLAAKV
jgi:hypothetical protein